MPNGTEDPETKNKELRFVLDDTLFPVTWVRVTCTRDSRNKRENYTINLYSGSSDDPPTPTRTTRLHLAISDHQFQNSGIDELAYTRKRIIEKRIACISTYFILHSFTSLDQFF